MKNSGLLKFFCTVFSIFIIESHLSAKVLLLTFVYNRPDFIELQVKTFKAFLHDEYEFVVFNDGPNDTMEKQISETCANLSVRCFRVPQEMHPWYNGRQFPNHRHEDGIKVAMESLGFDFDGITALVDNDMFLISPFSIEKYMEGYDFIGGYQRMANEKLEIIYSFPGLTIMDMRTLPNKRTLRFACGKIEDIWCDVGGQTYYYFKDNPSIKLKLYRVVTKESLPQDAASLQQLGYDDHMIKLLSILNKDYKFEFHGDGNWLHYVAGGCNWAGFSAQWLEEKNRALHMIINERLDYFSHN